MPNLGEIKKARKIMAFGNSMWPVLQEGDVVYLEKVKFDDIKVNDIVCFTNKSKLVTHRVVYKKGNCIIAKGDNNPISDGKIEKNRILGVVYAFKREGRKFNIEDMYLFQSSIYLKEIKKVARLLNSEAIDYVFLKGLPLHLWLEDRNPRRIFSDCDILISKKQKKKVKMLLENFGYKRVDVSLSQKHRSFRKDMVEESMVKFVLGYPIILDIHFNAAFLMTQLGTLNNLYPKKLLDGFSKSLLNNKRVVRYEGDRFNLLSLEDQVIYLFLHLFHHNYRGGHRYDILVRILKTNFDRNRFFTTIKRYKLSNYVYSVLILLQNHYPNSEYNKFIEHLRVSKIVNKYVNKTISQTKIYDEEERLEGGVKRFILLFNLSPEPLLRRLLIVFNYQVFYSAYWVFVMRMRQEIMSLRFFLKNIN